MAGFVVRNICDNISCSGCKEELLARDKVVENCKLIQRKDRGGLIYPSKLAVEVCNLVERNLRFLSQRATRGHITMKNINIYIQKQVLEDLNLEGFVSNIESHSCRHDYFELHSISLVRLIVNMYIRSRCRSVARQLTEQLRGKNVRVVSNKNVLFAHQ